jgi:hypothetical protein
MPSGSRSQFPCETETEEDLMKQRIIGIGAGLALVSLAAVGVFASQDGAPIGTEEDTPTVEASATPIDTTTPSDTDTPEATETPEATDTPEADDTETPEATETPDEGDDGEGEHHGIPDDNPVFGPDDGDGVCEKHESAEKTTPSGNVVTVPCHAVHDDEGAKHQDKHGDDANDDDASDDGSSDGSADNGGDESPDDGSGDDVEDGESND